MTIKEIRVIIKKSSHPNWFGTLVINLSYPIIPYIESELNGIFEIYRYYKNQISNWDSYEKIPSQFNTHKAHFIQVKERIEHFLITIEGKEENWLNSQWRSIQVFMQSNNSNRFPANHPDTLFLIKLFVQNEQIFNGAFNYYNNSFSSNSKDSFQGLMFAYEYKQDGRSKISKNIDLRKKSLDRYRSAFKTKINESEQILNEHLSKSETDINEFSTKIDELHKKKEGLFDDWFNPVKVGFEDFDKISRERITQLEKSYGELLKLKKPAEYWKIRAVKLNKDGWFATKTMITLIGIAIVSLYVLLVITPDGMTASFKDNTTAAIKWSIVYIMFISFLAYGIRIVHRVAFSSFHLAIDAEEREQLTYLYLSLMAESEISANDRTLVMQSLFSRADSGLLKEDSSPTMPNDIISKLISKAN